MGKTDLLEQYLLEHSNLYEERGKMSKYKKMKLLGKGATAEVYLVKEEESENYYAMKVGEAALLRREWEILHEVESPFFPVGKEFISGEEGVLVMEYITGNTLQEILEEGRSFSLKEILYIMDGVLGALHYLHEKRPSVIYRDLKAANIMIDKTGKIKVIDFGAAVYGEDRNRKTQETKNIMAGTYGYAAPEQFWSGAVLDRRCDIYAAGKVLAYLLSGKNPAIPPYDMQNFCHGKKKLPEPFLEIIGRSLAMNPLARYEDCEKMRREIHKAYKVSTEKHLFKIHKKSLQTFEKCIWLSEYRRIF